MSKHTPGKWEIEPLEVFGRGDREGTADIVVHDEDGEGSTVIAKGIGYEGDEEKANANLIAAAPDLLKALIDFLDDTMGDPEPCRKAIAKALGKSS